MASTADRAGRVVADPDPFHRAMTGPPEVTFGVADLALDDGAVTATMKLDARHTYRDQVAMGALGVLVDDALGFAILANRPDGFWSVSTEMRIDMLRPLPAVGAAVRVRASSIASSRSGGAATGEVLAPDGGVIAVGVQRSKFIEGTPGDLPPPVATGSAHVNRSMLATLGGTVTHDDEVTRLALNAGPRLINSLQILHGGVSFAAAALAAACELEARGGPAQPVSAHVSYARPIPACSDVTFTTTVQHLGRSVAVVDVTSYVEDSIRTITRVTAESDRGR